MMSYGSIKKDPIDRKRDELDFDADLPYDNPRNVDVAQKLRLTYDSQRRVYLDEDGCPTRDEFGQPLGWGLKTFKSLKFYE